MKHQVHLHLFFSLHQGNSLRHLPFSFVALGDLFRLYHGHGLPCDRLFLYLRDGVCVRNHGCGVPYLSLCLGHGNGPCFDYGDVRGYDCCNALGRGLDDFRPVALGKWIFATFAYVWFRLSGFETYRV